jgi:MATE family multidrug resistance protein
MAAGEEREFSSRAVDAAGTATTASEDAATTAASAGSAAVANAGGSPQAQRRFGSGWFGGYSRAHFRELLHLGLPAAGMLLFEVTAFAFSGIMMGWLGAVPLAAHQISISCASMAFMIPLGLSMAVGIRVSHVVGSDEREKLRPIAFGSLFLGMTVMAAFAVLFGFGGRMLAGWFVDDWQVVVLASQLLVVGAFFQMADGVQVIAAHLLRGISDVKIPTAITLVAYWVIALPLGYFLGVRGPWGPVGVWLGIASGLAFAAVFLTARFERLTRSPLPSP